jgi:eukaryotic-like serine/threonine-protein kinase
LSKPDETRIAVAISDKDSDVWIHELGRGSLTRLTSDPNIDDNPLWSPDGRRVFFRSNPAGRGQGLYSTAADGAGSVERVGDSASIAISFAPDGRSAVLQQIPAGTGPDLMLLQFQPTLHVEPLLATPFADWNAEISPDGRWMAYYSNESSQPQVYVRPFPNVRAGRIQISVNGGTRPAWSKDGREIFYMDRANALMAVSVRTSEPFTAGKPAKLLDGPWYAVSNLRPYDVARRAISDDQGHQRRATTADDHRGGQLDRGVEGARGGEVTPHFRFQISD